MKRAILFMAMVTSFVLAAPAPPHIDSLSPSSAAAFDDLTINGSGFGDKQGTSKVTIGGQKPAVEAWSSTQLKVSVPKLTPGNKNIVITVGGVASNGFALHVTM